MLVDTAHLLILCSFFELKVRIIHEKIRYTLFLLIECVSTLQMEKGETSGVYAVLRVVDVSDCVHRFSLNYDPYTFDYCPLTGRSSQQLLLVEMNICSSL